MDRHSDPARARHIASENRLPLRDPERMGALMRSLEPRLSAVALGVTKDPDGAQDVVQNAFEKVLRHGDKFRDWKVGIHGKRTGYWNGEKQYLLCAHCHNPHSPSFKAMKPMPPPVRPENLDRQGAPEATAHH